jgi:predicted esterase YcpF (UPF0227 family)
MHYGSYARYVHGRVRSAIQLCSSTYVSYLFPQLHSHLFESTSAHAMLYGLLGEESMSYTWHTYAVRHVNELACTDVEEYARSKYLFNSSVCTDELYNERIHITANAFEHSNSLLHCFVNVRWN